jgi:hypothetical protein
MGGGGAISGMQMSLKMNDRRRKREQFKKTPPPLKHEKTSYNVPTVSEYKRREIVHRITKRRRTNEMIGYSFLIISAIVSFLIVYAYW